MAHPRYVGLRISTTAGAVPTAADIGEGELAINVADGRVYTLAGNTVIDLTDRYSVAEVDSLLAGKADVSSLAAVATSGAYGDLTGRPTLGTAAPLDVPASGDAAAGEVVKGDDSRLSDARSPTAHTHPWGEVTSKPATATRWPTFVEVTSKPATYPPSSHSHTLGEITDAGSAAAEDTSAFDPAGSAAQVEHDIRETLRQTPDPLLMHFL